MEQLTKFFTFPGKAESEEEARNNQAKKAEFVDYFREPVLSFARSAVKYLAGVSGGYMAFNPEKPIVPASPEEVWADFSAWVERLMRLVEFPGGKDLASHPQDAALVLGYGALTMLRSILGKGASGAEAARLADHWQLIRKLSECLEKLGISAAASERAAGLARAVLARTAPGTPAGIEGRSSLPAGAFNSFKAPGAKETAAAIIMENYHADDFRRALGINRFDDVTWFNKEAFEETLLKSRLFLLPEAAGDGSEGAWRKQAAFLGDVSDSFLKAERLSGFKLEDLVGALTGEMPKKPASVKAKKSEGSAD